MGRHDPLPDLAAIVVRRLEHAGRTALSMPRSGYSTGMRCGGTPEIVRAAIESYGWSSERLRPPVPSASDITAMDEAYAWLSTIPDVPIRGVVGARSLIHPMTDRYLYPWRELGLRLNMHHNTVQKLHATGINRIVASLLGAQSAKIPLPT